MTDAASPDEDAEAGPPPLPAGLADERFAANIREERERQGKSQADIARLMRERGWSYHPQTVQRIEAGHRKVSVGEAEALARILSTTVDRLTWPGRAASTAAFLDQVTARAESAWEQIAAWTATLLWAQHQLRTSVAEAERAQFHGSDKIREIVREARSALEMTPEAAMEAGRRDHEELRETGAQLAAEAGHCPPLIHAEGGGPDEEAPLQTRWNHMDVGNSVRKAIDDYEHGEIDAAMLHACNAVDGTATKLHPNLGSNARFTKLLRDNYFILEPMAAPGINLEDTRFPVKVKYPKALGGQPDFADVIYGVHRCCHGHGEALPGGYELMPDATGQPGHTRLEVKKEAPGMGRVRFSDRLIFGLLAVAVFSPANVGQRVPDGYHFTFGRGPIRLEMNDWWGRAADFPAVAATEPLPRVTLDFADLMNDL